MIFRDNDLLADLADATSAFADLERPTATEWESYWRRNPIRAITTASRGDPPWFEDVDGRLVPQVSVDENLGDAFQAMVREITEYRLHRYLARQAARRVGEVRKPIEDGVEVDATFSVETTGRTPTSVVIMSAGGSDNTGYVRGFDLVLQRLAGIGARLVDAYIETKATVALPIADRRLDPGEDCSYPVPLAPGVHLEDMRRAMLRSMSRVGRAPDARGGGNQRKRTRLVIDVPEGWSAVALADSLAQGRDPDATLTSPQPESSVRARS